MQLANAAVTEYLPIILGIVGGTISIPTIVTTMIIKKLDKKIDSREAAAIEERKGMVLMLKALKANGQYTDAIAYSMEDGKVSGKMQEARAAYGAVSEELESYLISNAVNQMKER